MFRLQALNKGTHHPYSGDLGKLVADSRKLAAKIRSARYFRVSSNRIPRFRYVP